MGKLMSAPDFMAIHQIVLKTFSKKQMLQACGDAIGDVRGSAKSPLGPLIHPTVAETFHSGPCYAVRSSPTIVISQVNPCSTPDSLLFNT